jgi:hypothetical protein
MKVRVLSGDDPVKIRLLMEMGYSQIEIGELLQATAKAIQMKLYRARRPKGRFS